MGFIAQNAPRDLAPGEIPPGALRDEDRQEWLAHPDTQIMVEVFETLWEGAPALVGQGLEAFGISAQDRISPVADMDLARVYGAAARVLGNRHTGLYMGWEGDAEKVRIACHVGGPPRRPPERVVDASQAILDEELDLEGEAKTEWSAEDLDGYLDRSDHLRELCAFAVSEECFQARQALGATAQSTEDETLP